MKVQGVAVLINYKTRYYSIYFGTPSTNLFEKKWVQGYYRDQEHLDKIIKEYTNENQEVQD